MKKIFMVFFVIGLMTVLTACKNTETATELTDPTIVEETPDPTIVEETPDPTVFEDPNFYLVAEKNGLYGVINQDGEEVLPFEYGELSNVSLDGVMTHRKGPSDYELINIYGQVIQEGLTEIDAYNDRYLDYYTHLIPGVFFGMKDGVSTVYDSKGEYFSENLDFGGYYKKMVFSNRGHFELNELTKEFLNQYQRISQYSDHAYFALLYGEIFVLDSMGIVKESYPDATELAHQNFIAITTPSDLFLYDYEGNLISNNTNIEQAFSLYHNDYILILENGLYGVIDLSGEVIIDSSYTWIRARNGLIVAQKADYSFDIYYNDVKLNNIDGINTTIIPGYGYDASYVLNEPGPGDSYYYKGTEVIGGPYEEAHPFNKMGTASVITTNGIKGIMNDQFEIINQDYQTYIPFFDYYVVEGRIGSELGKYGIVNHLGEVVIPVQYSLVTVVTDGKHFVSFYDQTSDLLYYYLIDKNGELVSLIDLHINDVKQFYSDNMHLLYEFNFIRNYANYFNLEVSEGYEVIDFIHKDFLIAIHGDKFGVLNSSYEVIIPFEYDYIKGNLNKN